MYGNARESKAHDQSLWAHLNVSAIASSHVVDPAATERLTITPGPSNRKPLDFSLASLSEVAIDWSSDLSVTALSPQHT